MFLNNQKSCGKIGHSQLVKHEETPHRLLNESRQDTPTGASANPKNYDLIKNLDMNMI